jgi:Domain of unknown function (DUF4340)
MNSKSTWVWITIAAVLFVAILGVEKFGRNPASGPVPLLPEFQAAQVTSVQLGLADQPELRVERTNFTWQLTKPVSYPAQSANIDTLLHVLQRLAPAGVIPGSEVRLRKNKDQEFGFATPQATLTIQGKKDHKQILIGSRTAPGDQIYVQVVGVEDVYLVDAELLKLLPRQADDWRDTALADLSQILFDRLVVSNTMATLELQRDASNHIWRLTRPTAARADNQRLGLSLQSLNVARVTRFLTNNSPADLEAYGLSVPELELTLMQGTNTVATLQFGRHATNDSTQVYARRVGLETVVTVPNDFLDPWRHPLNDFRDPRVVSFGRPVDRIEFLGGDPFTLERTETNSWRAVGADFPVDAGWVDELINTLGNLKIEQFKDSINEPDLPEYGLDAPVRQVVVSTSVTNAGTATNLVLARLAFGVAKDKKIYVRRADENPVYAISLADFQKLPDHAWQLRERRVWNFSEQDTVRLMVQENGQRRELRRAGTNSWAYAPGSQGILVAGAVEETVHRYGELEATAWAGRGDTNRARFGFTTNSLTLSFELKTGVKHTVEIGGLSPAQYPYAAVKLAGDDWFFELSSALYQLTTYALSPAASPPP